MDRLGEKYTIDAIYDRLIDNQRLPELYVTHYPVRGRTPLMELEWEMKRLNRMDGIRLLFELFVALIQALVFTLLSTTYISLAIKEE